MSRIPGQMESRCLPFSFQFTFVFVFLHHSKLWLYSEYLRFYFKVLDEVPEDNCRFLEESGLKIFMAGMVRFYHIEVRIIRIHLMAQMFLLWFSLESCPTPMCSLLKRGFLCSSTGAQVTFWGKNLYVIFQIPRSKWLPQARDQLHKYCTGQGEAEWHPVYRRTEGELMLEIIVDVTLTHCVGGAGLLSAAEDWEGVHAGAGGQHAQTVRRCWDVLGIKKISHVERHWLGPKRY